MSFTTTVTSLFNPAPATLVRLSSWAPNNAMPDASTDAAATSTSRKRKRQTPSIQRDYPKRQRQAVSYAEIDSDDELINSSDEDEDGDYDDYGIVPRKNPKKTKPLPKHKIFPLLSLPRELRDMIYQHCLTDPIGGVYLEERTIRYRRTAVRIPQGPLHFINAYGGNLSTLHRAALPDWPNPHAHFYHYRSTNEPQPAPVPEPHKATLVPALLRVCRQVHAEAAPVLYGQPLFFADTCALHGLVSGLSRETRGLLRDVTTLNTTFGRSMRAGFDVAAITLLAEGGTGVRSLRFHDPCCGWRQRGRLLAKRAARRFYRRAFPWLDAVRKERGIAEAVAASRVFGGKYDVFLEDEPEGADDFSNELRKLIVTELRKG